IQAMIKPTEDMKAAIADAGYASGEALIENEGLSGALTLLRDASEGSNEVLGKMFGSVEGLSAVLALTGENAGTFADDLAAMADSTGAATDAFNQMEQSTGRQLDTLKASFSEIAMSIGDVVLPILKGLFDQIKPVIDKVIEWTKDNPQLTKTIVIVAGVIGVLMTVLGPLLLMLPTLMTAFTVLSGPIGLVTLAIMALIAIGVAVWQNWDTIRVKTIEIWGAISDFFKGIWDKIVGFFKDNWDKILAILFPAVGIPILIARHWEPIVSFFSDIWEKVKGIFSNAWDGIVGIVKGSVNAVLDFINGMIGGVEAGINAVIGMINRFRLVFPGLEILGKQIIPAFEWGLPEIPTMNLPRIPLLDTGGLVQGPGLFGVGAGVKEIVRTPGTGVTINAVNIYAETAEGGRRAGQGFFEEMQRRGIRLSGMYA
ncbi:MAG: phage tail tape measure protein, partial [Gammaproteobacteria bacterium]|nr:phage tail tape measure protein [Gammaproteobacteria bacterium]